MKPAVLLRDPDRVLLSTLAGKVPSGIDLMTVRIGNLLPHLNRPPNSSNSLGDRSVGVVPGDAEGDGVPTLVYPNRSHTSHINDNYWVGPTFIHVNQLTKAPFEPLKEASLKHLTFKTVFLLALGSGKRRSEIHAWLHKNIRHQSDWSKVSLYPSPSFLSKNQLAKEGPDSVAPVVIPALAPSLDRSLKGDRSLCPVRALHYYLDRTADLRQNKELVFVSFKKGFDKDISPATISSWIKQTVILCYERSDQEALTLHQVKAHDVRAFAASKAFQSGISLDQILSACHWKSHNTFTQFYLKDVAWADSELFHLGPVVAAQQVHHQAQR